MNLSRTTVSIIIALASCHPTVGDTNSADPQVDLVVLESAMTIETNDDGIKIYSFHAKLEGHEIQPGWSINFQIQDPKTEEWYVSSRIQPQGGEKCEVELGVNVSAVMPFGIAIAGGNHPPVNCKAQITAKNLKLNVVQYEVEFPIQP